MQTPSGLKILVLIRVVVTSQHIPEIFAYGNDTQ